MRDFLQRLGRRDDLDGMRIVMPAGRWPPPADKSVVFHDQLTLSGRELREMMQAASILCLGCVADDAALFPEGIAGLGESRSSRWEHAQYLATQLMAVAGPVHILWDISKEAGLQTGGRPHSDAPRSHPCPA